MLRCLGRVFGRIESRTVGRSGFRAIFLLLVVLVTVSGCGSGVGNADEIIERLEGNMVRVSGGRFAMGTRDGGYDARPQHDVTVSSFLIGKYEVTKAEWAAVMGGLDELDAKQADMPADSVSWDDCQTFLKRLNARTGRRFRLPTEAEWEFAARGGIKQFGYEYSGGRMGTDVGWTAENSGGAAHTVGTKPCNELGLHDMSGNVWEWCQDWLGRYDSKPLVNPRGFDFGENRVIRGGSWGGSAGNCAVWFRYGAVPSERLVNVGFRLAE